MQWERLVKKKILKGQGFFQICPFRVPDVMIMGDNSHTPREDCDLPGSRPNLLTGLSSLIKDDRSQPTFS